MRLTLKADGRCDPIRATLMLVSHTRTHKLMTLSIMLHNAQSNRNIQRPHCEPAADFQLLQQRQPH